MMPNMRQPIKGLGRRITCQVIKEKIVDRESVIEPRDILRTSIVMYPMPERKLLIKPEGQRDWKWWEGVSSKKLKLGWFIRPDKDKKKLYEVMSDSDFRQARFFAYQFAEAPR